MSSSPKLAPLDSRVDSFSAEVQIEPFAYDAVSSPGTSPRLDAALSSLSSPSRAATDGLPPAPQREAQIRQQGIEQGKLEARKLFEEQLSKERTRVTGSLAQFAQERTGYFEKIEGEVVALALAIARKILHRESQIDPLLLAGMVRVALETLEGATQIVVRVHPSHATEWKRYFQAQFPSGKMPEIVEDAAQPLDSCLLQTSLGTTSLGIESQLKEIERGLLDLLAARPAVRPGATS